MFLKEEQVPGKIKRVLKHFTNSCFKMFLNPFKFRMCNKAYEAVFLRLVLASALASFCSFLMF